MFSDCSAFNSDISDWNVANAKDLSAMLCGCSSFDSDGSRWNVMLEQLEEHVWRLQEGVSDRSVATPPT
jgi:surface protein